MTRDSRRTRALAAGLALLVGLTFVAPPAFAADPAPEPAPTPQPTLVDTAEATLAAMPAATLASAVQSAPEPTSAPSDPSFFKTGKGAAVLVLLAAGVGYSAYSAVHDRNPVKSPIR